MADPPKIATDFAPYQPAATADDFAPVQGEPGQGKILSNEGTDDPWGRTKNAGTSAIKGLIGLGGGMLGDIGQVMDLVRTGAMQTFGDKRSHEEITKADAEEREDKAKAYAQHRRAYLETHPEARQGKPAGLMPWSGRKPLSPTAPFDPDAPGPFGGKYAAPLPATTQDIYDAAVKPRLGEYEPQTTAGHIGSFAVTAATPGGLFSKLGVRGPRVLAEAPSMVDKAINVVRGTRPATIGAGAGALAGTAEQIWHNPYITTGVALGSPVGLETGASYAGKKGFAPKTREDNARGAAERMKKDIAAEGEDPAKVYKTAEETYANQPEWMTEEGLSGEAAPGAPTIAEAGKSKALAQSELATSVTSTSGNAKLQERAAARDQARENAGRGMVDELATGEEPKSAFKKFTDELDQRVDETLPKVGSNEDLGADTRKPLQEGRKSAEDVRSELFDTMVERFGDQTVLIPGLRKAATGLAEDHVPGYSEPRSPDKHTQMALGMPDEVKFKNLRRYLKDLNLKIANARGNPALSEDLGQLKNLKRGVMDDINNAVANWEAHDADLVARGQLDPANTFTAALKRQRDAFYAARAVGDSGSGHVGLEPAGEAGVPGSRPTGAGAGSERAGTSGAGGDGAVSGGSGRLDAAGAKALEAGNAAQQYLGRTYRESAVGPILKPNRFGDWNMKDSQVPRAAFPGGPDGYTITKEVLNGARDGPGGAVHPDMVQTLKDTAIMTLRSELKSGRLTPQALEKWQNKYATSLRAIDEASPGFSKQFDNLANTQSELAAKFAGARNAAEGANFMGEILRMKDGASQLARLVAEAGPEPAVAEGFKKLIIDHMFNEAEKGASGGGELGVRLRKQIIAYDNVLRESGLFPPEQMKVMEQLAQDVSNQQAHRTNMKPAVAGSPTAHRTELIKQRFQEPPPMSSTAGEVGTGFGISRLFTEGFTGDAIQALMGISGYNIASRFLHRMKTRGIHNENDLYKAGMVDPQLGLRMLRHGVEGQASPTWLHRVSEGMALSPLYAMPGLEEEEKKKSRASGGRVEMLAKNVIRAVDQARQLDTKHTKPLLQQDDSQVANALAIAGRHI